MTAMAKFLVPLTIFLSASLGDAFLNHAQLNHLIRFDASMSNPTNEPSHGLIREPTKQMELDAKLPNNLSPMKTRVAYREPKQDAELPSKVTDSTNTQTCGLYHDKKSEPESLMDQLSINEEIDYPVAATNISQQASLSIQYSVPTANEVSYLAAYPSLLSAHLVDCHVGFNLLQ